jgi:hypothetical protein
MIDHALLPLLLAYFALGLVVYRRTDSSELVAALESRLVAAPALLLFETVFFGVVTFWPLWLVSRRQR